MPAVVPAPLAVPLVDKSGQINPLWSRFFISAQAAIDPGSAPSDARYLISTANSLLPQAANLGNLTSGYLKLAVALGIATPSTTATLPAADLTGALPALSGAALTALNASALTSGTIPQARLPFELDAGVYTPILTNVVNVSASTAYAAQYLRVGSVVTVSGQVDIDPTGAGDTQLGISLPVASNLASANQLAGTAASAAVAGLCAAVLGDATNNRGQLEFVAVDLANRAWSFSFQYVMV